MENNNQRSTPKGARKPGWWRYGAVAVVCGLGIFAVGQSNREPANPYPASLKPGAASAASAPAAEEVKSAPPASPRPAPGKVASRPAPAATNAAPTGASSLAPPAAPAKRASAPAASAASAAPPRPQAVPAAQSVSRPPAKPAAAAGPKPQAPRQPAPPRSASSAAGSRPVSSRTARRASASRPRSSPPPRRLLVEQEADQVFQHIAAKKLYSFRALNTDIKVALAMFARANHLNIVPDADVTGTVTLDVRDLSLEQMMRALLEANDFTWDEEGGLIRVRAFKTETFQVDYLRLSRNGQGQNSASLSAASSSGGRGGGGGISGGGGGGTGGSGTQGGSSINVTAQNDIDFWKEFQEELSRLLTEKGRETMAVNMTAGLIQITDRPSALKRVARYLEDAMKGVRRQVDLEAKLYDVLLNDEYQLGVDWEMVAQAGTGLVTGGGSTIVSAPIGGLTPSAPTLNLTFQNDDVTVILQALQQQGEVTVISKPRIRTLNNQTALIKVGTETPFFSQRSTIVPGVNAAGSTVLQDDQVTTITVGTILSITPQISDDDWICLDISPVLTSLVGVELSPSETTTAPVLDIKQASTLVRVKDGATVVMGGLIQNSRSRTLRKIPIVGDIPVLGKVFQGRYDASQKKELVIFITPRIVRESL